MDFLRKFHSVFFFLRVGVWRIILLLVFLSSPLYAQELSDTLPSQVAPLDTANDILTPIPSDSLVIADSSAAVADSAGSGAPLSVAEKEARWGIKIARDALPSTVTTTAKDSAVLDMKADVFYLYGAATAKYDEVGVKSGQLIFYQKKNILVAEPILDTAGKIVSLQEFSQGSEQFTFDTLKYNFHTEKALVRNARTQYGEGFVISEQIKRNPDETIYGWKNLYTTCNLPHPHFGIHANKIKVIPGRIIASGPANLEIQDVPTPLFLPFGLFPIKQGQHSGFILPSYTMQEARGLGLERGGYYFAINDYLGVITQFNIYSKGSWAASGTAQYVKRYRYSGNLSLNYAFDKTGEDYEPQSVIQKNFQVTWNHRVDPKARPGTQFSAMVNFGTSDYNKVNGYDDYNSRLNNQYASSISYSKSWVGKPYSFTAAIRHSQSTQTHQVTVSLPELNFNLGQFSPFQRKNMSGNPRWYEKIVASYNVSLVNQWDFIDSTLRLDQIKFSDFNNGMRHTASLSATYNVLRFFNLNFNMPYTEYWNTKQTYLYYTPDNQWDTTMNTGFFATRDFNFSVNLSTRIYGLKMFKKGKIRGLRHVLTPTIGIGYQPGFAHDPFNYFYSRVNTYGDFEYVSPYALSPINGPSNPENSGMVNFSLGNTLQMKVRSRSEDSATTKNISLIDGLNISGSYDMFRDSCNFSPINMSFRTSILDKINISAVAVFDPYLYQDGVRTNRLRVRNNAGVLGFEHASFTFGIRHQAAAQDPGRNLDSAAANNDEIGRLLQGGTADYYDFNIPWRLSVNGGLSIQNQHRRNGQSDTLIIRPTLTFDAGFNLTERWKINMNGGLAFNSGFQKVEMGYTSFDITRDLHCWQMTLNLIPFGTFRSFTFTLQVKASVLQDLKLIRRKAYQDNIYY